MCEALGTEPVEEEIPLEYSDLPTEVQEAMIVYNMLQDNWDTMGGQYMGKVLAGIADIFEIAETEDPRTTFFIIGLIDRTRSQLLNKKQTTEKPAKSP